MLEIVPCEVILDIADWLLPGDLRAFRQVCSRVNSILVPLVYRTLTFRAPSEWALNVLDTDSFFWNHPRSQGLSYL
ncbi:Cyclin-like F-box [Penicillium camemberti]|uniref:Cyclin-like F-box n=1 Tax=Penicillium camemberti (strain FM 013) TaxID=1429867 RepID=A0A0G4PVL3_PENC3|nr:Cyclin-like F-box [Penicillium camemberti]